MAEAPRCPNHPAVLKEKHKAQAGVEHQHLHHTESEVEDMERTRVEEYRENDQ